ncbi:MAG: flagellar basal body rod protein FlgC [Rhodanobacteraceae bacterium]
MGLTAIFGIAGSAMGAESVRLSTVASNLANANATAGSADAAYRTRMPVFQTVPGPSGDAGVEVSSVVETTAAPARRYAPHDPQANAQGYVYDSTVNPVDAMVNMISASRSYQNDVETLNTAKQLMLDTLKLSQ